VRDALEMRRGIREKQYDNRYTNVQPLVPRYLRYPVEERLDYKGDVITGLNEGNVLAAIDLFKNENVESLAVCFMNSFANEIHESRAAEIIQREWGADDGGSARR
jgi:N-methylhydantoinase A